MDVTATIDFTDVVAKLNEIGPKLARQALRKAVRASGDMWVEEMKGRVPVDTGNLRDSIRAKVRTKKLSGGVEAKVSVGPAFGTVDRKPGDGSQQPGVYGMFVELGTEKMVPRPYMRPTFDTTKDKAVEVFADTLRDELEDIVKG
jgi:HK97 gp10 family phage protein